MKNKNYRDRQLYPSSEKEALAGYVAEKLKDTELLPFYVTCVNRYTEASIRQALRKTLRRRFKKTRDRRGFFFKQLIYEYATETYDRSRHKSGGQMSGRRHLPGSRTPGLEDKGDQGKMDR